MCSIQQGQMVVWLCSLMALSKLALLTHGSVDRTDGNRMCFKVASSRSLELAAVLIMLLSLWKENRCASSVQI